MRKTAPDGESAGELPEVTTDAHSQTTQDSEHSLEERDTAGRRHERLEASPNAGEADARPRRGAAEGDGDLPPSAAGVEDEERELDFEQAERFAASFRPSWEPDEPPASTIPPTPFVGATGGPARVVRHSTRGDLSVPKLRKHRGTAYATLGACLIGVGGLLYMAIASSSVRPSAEHASRTDWTETRIEAMRAPAAPPADDPSARAATAPSAQAEPPHANAPAQDTGELSAPALPNPSAQAAVDPNAQAAVDPSAQAAVDPNAQGDLDPSAQAAVDPNAQGDLDPNAVPAGTDFSGADPNAATTADAIPGTGANAPPNAVPAGTDPTGAAHPALATANPNAAAAADAVPAGTSANASPNAVPAGSNPIGAANPDPAAATHARAQADVPDIKTPEQTPAAVPGALPSPQPSAARPAAGGAPEKANKVLLSLAAHPPNTRLKLDGAPIQNPFRGRLPRSSKHRIEARAPGYAPEVHSVRLENDVQLMISLKREPPPTVKPDPYRERRRTSSAAQPSPARSRGAGFVAENPY